MASHTHLVGVRSVETRRILISLRHRRCSFVEPKSKDSVLAASGMVNSPAETFGTIMPCFLLMGSEISVLLGFFRNGHRGKKSSYYLSGSG